MLHSSELYPYQQILKILARDKHASLFCRNVSDGEKEFFFQITARFTMKERKNVKRLITVTALETETTKK